MLAFKSVLAVFFIAAISAAPVEEDVLVKRLIHSSGPGTYFYQNQNPGNCGRYSKDSEYVVALNNKQYAGGKNCGKKIKVTNKATGKSITATVQDRCPTCAGDGNHGIDLSEAAFMALGDKKKGVLQLEWSF